MIAAVNQNRQFYVAKKVETLTDKSEAGAIEVGCVDNGVKKEIYFKYKGADTTMRSQLIQVENLANAKAVKADDLADELKQVKVTLDPDVNGGSPISGQDYILRIVLRQFYGMSDEDQYFKYGAVHAYEGMTAETFYKKMAESLKLNFSREISDVFEFEASADGLLIKEKEQPWHLGTYAQERVYFDVYPTVVFSGGDEVTWGVTQATGETKNSKGEEVEALESAGTIKDGKKIADLEYFCMGERGDQYRNVGWPNVVPTTYMVDPSKEYHVLELHHAFTDSGAESYKSEKDITIVSDDTAVINGIISEINSKAGTSIATLA